MTEVTSNRINYSEYSSNCIPMRQNQAAQSHSHFEDCACNGKRNQADSSLDKPAVIAMVPMSAWSIAIL